MTWKLRKYNLLNRHERPIKKVPSLKKGDVVKLIFEFDEPIREVYAERLWVSIDKISGSQISGRIDNDPIYLEDLKDGSRITFTKKNVYDVYED